MEKEPGQAQSQDRWPDILQFKRSQKHLYKSRCWQL